ncbi:MAG: Arc family DNA-binding protein [Cetobacterium sp.]
MKHKVVNIRFPEAMWEEIKRMAEEENRSFHNMVIEILRRALKK